MSPVKEAPAAEPIAQQWFNPVEAAAYLRVTPRWMQRRREYRDGPPYTHVGQAIRYKREDLDAWMDAHRVEHVGGAA